MVTVGLLVTMTVAPGKQPELAAFLRKAVEVARAESDTAAWFAVQLDDTTFGVFEVFGGQAGRSAHLAAANTLVAEAGDLLAGPPQIQPLDVLAAKL
ncbi:MAG TPA: antibiotic biosynthesis monooxygenase [Acidimicrobiales bacterium]|jgi:quinol monooxygenase YgiN|nr:antibiotic biosynthesis monooxygenase [Acidimicrobiales bacterium]